MRFDYFCATELLLYHTMSCCLCKQTLARDRRRKRKLHGDQGKSAAIKEQLQALSSVPLDSLIETRDKDAYLCSGCENQITSFSSLNDKVAKLRRDIQIKISTLQPVLLLGKRLQGPDCEFLPPEKQVCSTEPPASDASGVSEQVSPSHEESQPTPTTSVLPERGGTLPTVTPVIASMQESIPQSLLVTPDRCSQPPITPRPIPPESTLSPPVQVAIILLTFCYHIVIVLCNLG